MPLSHAERQKNYRARQQLIRASRDSWCDAASSRLLKLESELASLRDSPRDAPPNGFDKEKGTQKEITSLTPTPCFILTNEAIPQGMLVDEAFKKFWKAWPHKVERKAALKAFPKALKAASLGTILAGVETYIAHKPHERPWLNPTTWLNRERWNDVYANGLDAGIPQRPPPSEAERQSAIGEILEDLGLRC